MKQVYSAEGLPELDMSGKQTSAFEFWPMWLMYLPVVLQWIVLAIYYRSLTLPLLANPKLPLSGMVGVGKSDLLKQAHGHCEAAILDWFVYKKDARDIALQCEQLKETMQSHGLTLPIVCKPDIGCRGSGVKLIKSDAELKDYIERFPNDANIVVQKLSDFEPEAGIFYVRMPSSQDASGNAAPKGKIISLAVKYTPYVVGDGVRTLQQLMQADPRVSELMHLYEARLADHLSTVLPENEVFRLVFSASHCRGAIFRDAHAFITPALTEKLNTIMADLPEFYYGRLDVKFASMGELSQGGDIQIIEINSASSEPLHIWDRKTSLFSAVSALLYQYRLLFAIGNINRKKGYKTPSISALIKAWRYEKGLVNDYPEND